MDFTLLCGSKTFKNMHLFYPLCKCVSNTPIELMKPTYKAAIMISFSEACFFDDNETGDIVICLILFLHQKQTMYPLGRWLKCRIDLVLE